MDNEFRRRLDDRLTRDWYELKDMLNAIHLAEGRDVVLWHLERSQKYSTKSLYTLMTSGVIDHYIYDGSSENH
jgi:hypothetical protein